MAEFETLYAALVDTGLPEESVWMTCAFGRGEMACLERTIALGAHVRVGFENAIVDSDGHLAHDNAERVARVAKLAVKHGRQPATPTEAAAILGQPLAGPRALQSATALVGQLNNSRRTVISCRKVD